MVLFPLIFFTNKIFVLITQLVFCRVWLVIELRFMASKLAIIQKKKKNRELPHSLLKEFV